MLGRRLLGIVFTPSWLRIAYVQLSMSRVPTVQTYSVPLPVGCINEDSGAIEDSNLLQQAMGSVPCINRRNLRQGGVFLVVPQLLCYRTAFVVPPERSSVSLQRLLDENIADLPGDRSSLLVDAYAHVPRPGESRAVMVLAARRAAIEAYTRLFGDDVWCIGGITTGEVARFNRWKVQYPEVGSKVVLVCGADAESRELSVWNRGVLTASDTRYWRPRGRVIGGARRGGVEHLSEQPETLVRDIMSILERQRNSGTQVECLCLGGAFREHKDLRERISMASSITCHVSTNRGLFAPIIPLGTGGEDALSGEVGQSGLFDDAIGAIAPKMASLVRRKGRVADGRYQSCA